MFPELSSQDAYNRVVTMVIECGAPMVSGTVSARVGVTRLAVLVSNAALPLADAVIQVPITSGVFAKMTDASLYTGSHKQKFAEVTSPRALGESSRWRCVYCEVSALIHVAVVVVCAVEAIAAFLSC